MIYHLYHWHKGNGKYHPDAFQFPFFVAGRQVDYMWGVEIDDIHQFIKDYEHPVMIIPPAKDFNYFTICISDGRGFGQK